MKAIDANAVRTCIDRYAEDHKLSNSHRLLIEDIKRIIDYAPSVEPEKIPVCSVTFDDEKLKALANQIRDEIVNGDIVLKDERPHGKWIKAGYSQFHWYCSNCGEHAFYDENIAWVKANFCHNCGADMRGEVKE